jgi:hypothetical protein
MSLHVSVVSIFGNHLGRIPEVFTDCGYKVAGPAMPATGESVRTMTLLNVVETDSFAKVVYFAHGCTNVVDLELVLMRDHEVWKKWSAELKTAIVCWVAEGTSNTYGFNVFYNGVLSREVLRCGLSLEETGVRVPPERTIQWSSAHEAEVLATVARIGAEYDGLAGDCDYFVYVLSGLESREA